MASRILDMGDMLTLIEQAEKTFDAEQAAKAAAKLRAAASSPSTTSSSRCSRSARWARSTKMLGMLPGMGQFSDQLDNFDEREIDRIAAIIQSMTPAERANPKIIDGSRRARIAKGSGVTVSDVNQLVDRFFEARKMMQQMARGGGTGHSRDARHGPGQEGQGPPGAAAEEGQGQAPVGQPGEAGPEAAGVRAEESAEAAQRLRPRWQGPARGLRPHRAARPLEVRK